MSRSSIKPPSQPDQGTADKSHRKKWPFRECDFGGRPGDNDSAELNAAALERFHLTREGVRKGCKERGEAIPEDMLPSSESELRLQLNRARTRAAAREEIKTRGGKVPDYLAETPEGRAAEKAILDRFNQEMDALRSAARREFETRGEKVPDYLVHRAPAVSCETALERARADIAAVSGHIVVIRAETARLNTEAEDQRRAFDSTPEGQEVLRLRGECRQMISNILQLDADTTRANRNADLLLSFCDHHIGLRPSDLPAPGSLSRYSTDFQFLAANCRRSGFNVPSDLTTVDQLSKFVRSEVPPQPTVTDPPPAPTESETKPTRRPVKKGEKTISRRRQGSSAPATSSLGF